MVGLWAGARVAVWVRLGAEAGVGKGLSRGRSRGRGRDRGRVEWGRGRDVDGGRAKKRVR